MPLAKLDCEHLQAAHGYLELGMFEEANVELEEIDPFCRHLPEVQRRHKDGLKVRRKAE